MARGRVRKALRAGWKIVYWTTTVVSLIAMVAVAIGWWRSAHGELDILVATRSVVDGERYSERALRAGSWSGAVSIWTSTKSGRLSNDVEYRGPTTQPAGVRWSTDWIRDSNHFSQMKSVEDSWKALESAHTWKWGDMLLVCDREFEGRPTYVNHSVFLKPGESTTKAIFLSHWLALVLTGILPSLALWRLNRWRRRRKHCGAGMCKGCGYDLRATPGRCPECGMEAGVSAV